MIKDENNLIATKKIIQKSFNQYQISLIPKLNSIIISIQQKNSYKTFESYFNLEYLRSFKLFISYFSIKEILEFISFLIEKNKIKIEEDNSNLKFILISTENANVELILNKHNILSNELIEKLKNKIKYFEEENKILKETMGKEILNINNKIEIIENKIKEIENQLLIEIIIKNKNEIKEYKNKIIELENRIIKLEKLLNKENKLEELNLKIINSKEIHDDEITKMSIFPLGNIITVSKDKSIKIFDIQFNLLQHIQNAHENSISYIDIEDENNFMTCSYDKTIKTWIKNGNIFKINIIINKAHYDFINKVIYFNRKLISCSDDNFIKIWEKIDNNYQNSLILTNYDKVWSILLLEDKNILISGGKDGTKFWNLNNFEFIICFKETFCGSWNGICRIDDDKIIVESIYEFTSILIISISRKLIIKSIKQPFYSFGINVIKEKGIILVGGYTNDIKVYRNDNFECIQTIHDNHHNYIIGFCELKNGIIIAYGDNGIINFLKF